MAQKVEASHEKNGVDASKPVGSEHDSQLSHEGLCFVILLNFASSDGLSNFGCRQRRKRWSARFPNTVEGSERRGKSRYLEPEGTEQIREGRLEKRLPQKTAPLPSKRAHARSKERSRRGLSKKKKHISLAQNGRR